MNRERIDYIIQYALSVAANDDRNFYRDLGPIHLLKYLYLADLAWAEGHGGESYTGISWKFHNFGPWSYEATQRFEPALREIHARKKALQSQFEGDFVRWTLPPSPSTESEVGKNINYNVRMAVRHAVQKFGSDTASLLNYVYSTRPMRRAAPGDMLDLGWMAKKQAPPIPEAALQQPTVKQKKKRRAKVLDLKNKMRQRREANKADDGWYYPKLANPEATQAVIDWMDRMAGPPVVEADLELDVSDDIWSSKQRTEDEIP